MRLGDLHPTGAAHPDVEVTGVTADSRRVKPGDLFAALPGQRDDGARHIPAAIAAGAVAVLGPPGLRADAPVIVDTDPRRAMALIAAKLYPHAPRTLVGVTGTNGKSSVVGFARQIWSALGRPAASIGTIGVETGAGEPLDLGHTTPDPEALHQALDRLGRAGVEACAMEVSSHGLDQRRADGCRFAAVALTHITRDHFDYHGGFEAYVEAKLRLLRDLPSARATAVLNRDMDPDIHARAVAASFAAGLNLMNVGFAEGADLKLSDHRLTPEGQSFGLLYQGVETHARTRLIGPYQASNVAVALGLVVAAGVDVSAAFAAVDDLKAPRGRMERAGLGADGAAAYVDYAHTPDALARALDGLRAHGPGEIVVVFGCGGDRDRAKRPLMAEAAAARADRVIVTDDNPRSEDAGTIRREAKRGAPDAEDIGDRREAILAGAKALGPGDVLLVAGKGHEAGQIVGDEVRPFDDLTVTAEAMAMREGA